MHYMENFGTSKTMRSKSVYLGEDDILHYIIEDKKDRDGLYIPLAMFVTSYARELTQRTSQAIMDYSIKKYNKNLYVYSDTDSISALLPIDEIRQFCKIDDVELRSMET